MRPQAQKCQIKIKQDGRRRNRFRGDFFPPTLTLFCLAATKKNTPAVFRRRLDVQTQQRWFNDWIKEGLGGLPTWLGRKFTLDESKNFHELYPQDSIRRFQLPLSLSIQTDRRLELLAPNIKTTWNYVETPKTSRSAQIQAGVSSGWCSLPHPYRRRTRFFCTFDPLCLGATNTSSRRWRKFHPHLGLNLELSRSSFLHVRGVKMIFARRQK